MTDSQSRKSMLEIILMPFAIAAIGVFGTITIAAVQTKSAERQAEAERNRVERQAEAEMSRARSEFKASLQVKLLDIFGEQIFSESEDDRRLALILLSAVEPGLAGNLTDAIARLPDRPKLTALARSEMERRISLSALPQPESVSPGQRTCITIVALDGNGNPLPETSIRVSAGGGRFLRENETYDPRSRLHSPYYATGKTDSEGRFKTYWACNPCAGGYVMAAEAEKDGFTSGKTEFTISIK
ncbi:MAG: hypothetical protein ACYSWW_21665 [Planctomycetota bacterium]|jgi:hypothetical protein